MVALILARLLQDRMRLAEALGALLFYKEASLGEDDWYNREWNEKARKDFARAEEVLRSVGWPEEQAEDDETIFEYNRAEERIVSPPKLNTPMDVIEDSEEGGEDDE